MGSSFTKIVNVHSCDTVNLWCLKCLTFLLFAECNAFNVTFALPKHTLAMYWFIIVYFITYSTFQCHATCPSHHSSIDFYDSHNTWKAVKIIKLPIMHISPTSCHFPTLRSKYSHQHTSATPAVYILPIHTQQDQVYTRFIVIRMYTSHLTDERCIPSLSNDLQAPGWLRTPKRK
jgi:hypothetical protein